MKEVSKGVVLQVAARNEHAGHHRAAKASRRGHEESFSRKGPQKILNTGLLSESSAKAPRKGALRERSTLKCARFAKGRKRVREGRHGI